jgi:hypothetical protein
MFANSNDVYIASIRCTFTHDQGKTICEQLKSYVEHHWEFNVLLERATFSTFGCVLEVRVERAYTNMRDFAEYINNTFIPTFKDYVNYVVVNQLKLTEIYWPKQFHFSVNNAQKSFGYTDLQINDGGRSFYNPEIPSHIGSVGTYLDNGDQSGKL